MFWKNYLHISKGIRLISWATAVRYAGWGFVEIFIPVFLLSFVNNFAEAGLLKSIYEIMILVSLPVVSRLADRLSSRKVILSGLVLYPIISLCYFYAGLTGAVILIVIARFFNGISFSLDSVGKKTYMRRHAHHHVGVVFGYFDTVSIFWWLAAAVVGLYLMKIFPLYQLFLLIIPTTIIAICFISLIPREPAGGRGMSANFLKEVYRDYRDMLIFIKNWTLEQKYTAILYSLAGVMFVVIGFFLPLVTFINNHSNTLIFLLTAFAALPYVFGVPLGYLADRADTRSLRAVLIAGIFMLGTLPFIDTLWIMLAVVFIIGLCAYYSMLVLEQLATAHEKRAHMGSLSGAFLSVFQLAQVLAPIAIGYFIDLQSLSFAIFVICFVGVLFLIPLFMKRVKLFDAV